MNPTEQRFQVSDHIAGIVTHVFGTMLMLQPIAGHHVPAPTARVSGAIGIAGDNVTGTVYLHFPEPLAAQLTQTMLGSPATEIPGDSDINDVIGELSNMVGTRLKSLLNDADIFCAVSTPSVIRGAFAVEAPQEVTAEMFYFTCLEQWFAVEVHLQLAEAPMQSI